MADREIRYGIKFDVDSRSLTDVKKSLEDIRNLTGADLMKTGITTVPADARKKIEQLGIAIEAVDKAMTDAFNPKLNTVNIQAFHASLKRSGTSLQEIHSRFNAVGPVGDAAFRRVSNQVLHTNLELKQTNTILDKMATTLGNTIKWNLASGAVNTLTRSLEQAWGYTKALDTSLNNIRIVTGKSADEMGVFAEKANDAAKNLGKTTTDYTDAALIYAQQGLGDREVEARTNITLKTANVTGESAEKVSEQLTAIWNGYKADASEAEVYVDRLAAVAATTASDLGELATGMSKVASAAATLGVDEEQLAAQLSTIISVTKQAPETVGTALRTFYARITDIKNGTDEQGMSLGKYSGELAKMGINILDVNGNLRDMGTVVEEIGAKWQTMSREEQIALAQTAGGQRQYSNLVALFDNFDQYESALNTARNAQGTLQEQQDIYMESTKAHLNELKASWEDLYDSVVDMGPINTIIDGLSMVVSLAADFTDALGGGVNALTLLGSIATKVFSTQISKGLNNILTKRDNQKKQARQFDDAIAQTQRQKGYENISEETRRSLDDRERMLKTSKYMSPENFKATQAAVEQMGNAASQIDALNEANKESIRLEQQAIDKMKEEAAAIEERNQKKRKNLAANQEEMKQQQDKSKTAKDNQDKLKEAEKLNKQAGYLKKREEAAKIEGIDRGDSEEKRKADRGRNLSEHYKNDIKERANAIKQLEIQDNELDEKLNNIIKDAEKMSIPLEGTEEEIEEAAKGIVDQYELLTKRLSEVLEAAVQRQEDALTTSEANQQRLQDQLTLEESIDVDDRELNIQDEYRNQRKANNEGIKRAQQRMDNAQSVFNAGMDEAQRAQAISGAVDIVASLTEIGASINAIHELGSIISDENLSGFEKFTQFSMGSITATMSLVQGFTSLTEGLGMFTAATATATGAVGALNVAATFLEAHLLPIAATLLAIGAVAWVWDAMTMSAAEAQEQIEKTNQALSEFNSNTQDYHSERQSLESMAQEYETLSKKAGEYDKNISSLTDSEKARYTEIKNKIISLNETSVAYYDAQGNAILRNNDELRETIRLLDEKQKKQAEKLFTGEQFDKNNKAYSAKYNDAKNELENAKNDKENMVLPDVSYLDEIFYKQEDLSKISDAAIQARNKLNDAITEGNDITAKELNEWKEAILGTLDDDYDKQAVEDYFGAIANSIEQGGARVAQAEENLKKNQEIIPLNEIIGVLQINSDYNSGYNKITEMGYTGAESFIAAYAEGLQLGMEGIGDNPELLYGAANKGVELLANTLDESSQSFFDYAAAAANINSAKNFGEYQKALMTQINNFLKTVANDPIWKTMSDEMKAQYIKAAFPMIQDINVSTLSGGLSKANGMVMKQYSQSAKEITDFLKNANYGGGEAFSAVQGFTQSDLNNKEDILTYLQKVKEEEDYVVEGAGTVTQRISHLVSDEDIEKAKLYGQALSQIRQASNLSELSSAEENFKNAGFADIVQQEGIEIYYQKLQQLAEQYENTTEELQAFQAALNSTDENLIAAAQNSLTRATRAGQLAAQLGVDANELEYQARVFKEMKEYAHLTEEELVNMAAAQMRYNNAVEASNKNLDKWKEAIKALKKDTHLAAETGIELQKTYGDLLNIDGSLLPPSFVEDLDNLELFEKALNGSNDAMNELAQNAVSSILIDIGYDEAQVSDLMSQLNEQLSGIEIGEDIDLSPDVQNALTQLVNSCAGSVSEAQAILDSLQIHVPEEAITSDTTVTETDVNEQGEVKETGWTVDASSVSASGYANAPTLGSVLGVTTVTGSSNVDLSASMPQFNLTPVEIKEPTEKSDKLANYKIDWKQATKGAGNNPQVKKKAGTPIKSKNGGKGGKGGKGGGGGGKGKSNKTTAEKIDKSKPQQDRYRKVNEDLKKRTNTYEKLAKNQDKLFGKNLVKNIEEQNKALDKQLEKLRLKQKMQQQDLKNQKKLLESQYGLKFNSTDDITNKSYKKLTKKYDDLISEKQDEINDFIEYKDKKKGKKRKYNKKTGEYEMSDKDKEKLDERNKELDKLKKELEKILSEISDYDKIKEAISEGAQKIADAIGKKLENVLKVFKMASDLRQNAQDVKFALWDWRRTVNFEEQDLFGGYNDYQKTQSDYETARSKAKYYFRQGSGAKDQNGDLLKDANGQVYGYSKGIIPSLIKDITTLEGAVKEAQKSGMSQFGNAAQTRTLLEEKVKQLQDATAGYVEQIQTMQQAALDMIEVTSEDFSKRHQEYAYVNEVLQHGVDLVGILYGDKAYKKMSSFYAAMRQNNEQAVEGYKKEYDYWTDMLDAAQKQQDEMGVDNSKLIDLYKEKQRAALTNLNNSIKQSAELLRTEYTNIINEIFDDLDKKVTQHGTDYIQMEWDLIGKANDDYLDEINRQYSIKDIERKYQKAIDESSNLKTQKALKTVMDEQLKILKEKDKLTQYDVERAEKVLALEQAKAAFEDARASKTTMRLKRDAQGNYSYQYVADNDAVEDAAAEVERAQNELYNFDKDQYNNNLQEILALWTDFQQEYKEASLIEDENERMKKQLLIRTKYEQAITGKIGENESIRFNLMSSASTEYAALLGKNLTDFNNLTDVQKNKFLSDLVPGISSGIQTLANNLAGQNGFTKQCKDAFDEADAAAANLKTNFDTLATSAGVTEGKIQNLTTDVQNLADAISGSLSQGKDAFTKQQQDRATAVNSLISSIRTLKQELENGWGDSWSSGLWEAATGKDGAVEKGSATIIKSDHSGAEAAEKQSDINNQAWEIAKQIMINQYYHRGWSKLGTKTWAELGGGTKNQTEEQARTKGKASSAKKKGENRLGDEATKEAIMDRVKQVFDKNMASAIGTYIDTFYADTTYGAKTIEKYYPDEVDGTTNQWSYEKFKKKYATSLDTGGYTGEWDNSEGKWALLHQKEIVLNKTDTKNLLDSVTILRSITSTLGGDILDKLSNIKSGFSSMYESAESIEQNVHIEASFPNVNSKKEIEEAFSNLVNLAAQRAMRRK